VIPADHFIMNPDGTAWWVPDNSSLGDVGGDMMKALDRPCDSPDCIDGRHTFTVEVAWQTEVDAYESETHRVSVVPGMVLPIVGTVGAFAVLWENHDPNPCILWKPDNVYRVGPKLLVGNTLTPITLPPAAAPGMRAVKLAVAS
jgi:hypothetical protein